MNWPSVLWPHLQTADFNIHGQWRFYVGAEGTGPKSESGPKFPAGRGRNKEGKLGFTLIGAIGPHICGAIEPPPSTESMAICTAAVYVNFSSCGKRPVHAAMNSHVPFKVVSHRPQGCKQAAALCMYSLIASLFADCQNLGM